MNQFHRTSRLQPRLAVTALLLAGMAMAVAATTRAEAADQAPTHTVVAQGEPTELARFQGSAWTKGDGCLECGGMDNFLFADELTFLGDFKVKVRMSLTGVKNSAASFCIGEHSHFGFDGGGGPMFVQGPALGRTTRFVGEYTDFLTEGEPFDFEVTRQDGKLAISIDGKQAYQQKSTGLLGPVGLRPWRATMRVYDLTITGEAARLPEITQPRAYTIPTIDLSHQKHRQVIVERKPGQYLGHPTTVLMPDCKTIYCTYPLGHGGPAAVLKKSTDGGLTWSDRLPVPDNWSTARNCPCIHRLTDPQGVERLFVFEGNGAMRQAHSLDGGKTWTPFEPNGLHCVVAPITIVPIEGDRLLAMYHRGAGDRDRPPLELWQSISDDGGLTWGPETKVADYPAGNPCEPFVLRSPDGKQLVALARENARRYNSLMIKSDDEGKTWSQPVQLPASLTGDRHMGRYGPDGRLVICFRDTAYESPTRGDFVAWVGIYDDIVNLREGQYRVRLLRSPRKGDLGYPGMELLPDGTFVATTYAVLAPGEKNSVVSVRFTLEEIDEEATRLPEQIDVFTSGEDGYHTYRIPAVLVTPEGTVLAFCEGRKGSRSDTGDIDLLLKRSTDGGRTFSKQQIVWNDGPNTCGNPCSVIDRTTGKIHLLLTHNLGVDTEREIVGRKSEGTRTVWVATSDDDGESWSKPRRSPSRPRTPTTGPGTPPGRASASSFARTGCLSPAITLTRRPVFGRRTSSSATITARAGSWAGPLRPRPTSAKPSSWPMGACC